MHAPANAVADEPRARLDHVLRMHVLERIDDALERASLHALLVKGASLALTVYPRPWLRKMGDIDLLVNPHDQSRILRALEAAGFRAVPISHATRYSHVALGERKLTLAVGPAESLVEVHPCLDKVVARPVPWRALLRRSRPCPGLPRLRVPGREDHALLVILHLAAADFDHPAAWGDLDLLTRSPFDWRAFEHRARWWGLATPCWLVLRALEALSRSTAPPELAARLRPSPLRARLLSLAYPEGATPTALRAARRGWPWVVRQTPLRDDTVRWLAGVARYAWLRVRDRGGSRRTVLPLRSDSNAQLRGSPEAANVEATVESQNRMPGLDSRSDAGRDQSSPPGIERKP